MKEMLAHIPLFIMGAAIVILAVNQVYMGARLRKLQALKRRMDRLVMMDEPVTLGELLNGINAEMGRIHGDYRTIEAAVDRLERQYAGAIVHTGLVSFDAFQTGQRDSFALCLMDASGNGLMLTGIYGSTKGRLYAKTLRQGAADEPLCAEEKHALAMASAGREGGR